MLATIFIALFALALGLVFCIWGYRLFLVLLPIFGFFAGFWLGAETINMLLGTGFLATVTGWVVGFIVGLVCALLSYLFYLAGVAIIAAAIGGMLAKGLMIAVGFDPGLLVTLVTVAGAIVVAVLALVLNLQKYVIIALTSIAGANLVVLSGLLLIGRVSTLDLQAGGNLITPITRDSWFGMLAWLVIAIAAFVKQLRTNRDYTFSKERYVEGWG